MSSTDPHSVNTAHHTSHKRSNTQQTSRTNTVYTHTYIHDALQLCTYTRYREELDNALHNIGVRTHLLSEWSGTVFDSLMHAFLQEHNAAQFF